MTLPPAVRRIGAVAALLLVVIAIAWASRGEHGAASVPQPVVTGPADVTIVASVTGRQAEPPPHRVTVQMGDIVAVTVTSDVDDEVHVHGIDVRTSVRAGEPATLTFVASSTGLFEIETHEAHTLLVQLVVS